MSTTPPVGRNPFGPVDSAAVVAALRAVGSYDPDALYAIKRRLLTPYRDLRRVAIAGLILACALLVLFSMPIFGAATLIASFALWRYEAKQSAKIESACADYLASAKSV